MPANDTKYLVSANGTEAFMKVSGRASYANCRNAGEFLCSMLMKGCTRISIECKDCAGMDSTFLGMIVGTAIKLRSIGGEVLLTNVNERIYEVIENLGVDKLITVSNSGNGNSANNELASETATSSNILSAHENLVEADASNKAKFEDVISFLKKETNS